MKRIALSIAALLLVAGCSPGAGNGGGGPLTLQVAGEAEEIAVYRTLLAAYERATDREVRLIEVASKDDHLQKLTTGFAAGSPPDVFLVNFREYPQFVVRGGLEPVGPHLRDEGTDLDAYYEAPLEAFTFDGELQCMPQNISSLVVHVNLDLFEEAGIEVPERWSWDRFREVARRLTRGDVKGAGIEPSVIRLAPFVWSNGGRLVDDYDDPTRFTLDEPEAEGALRYLVELAREDGVVPSREEVAAQDLETRFVTGKLAMYLSSRRVTPVLREQVSLRWDVAPLPHADHPSGILHSDAYCVARGGRLEEAMDLVTFATGREGQTITALGGRTVPSLRAVAESPAFLNPLQPPSSAEVYLDAIPHLQRTPVITTWPEIEDVADEILERAFYEEDFTVQEAIEELEAATRHLFEEASAR